MYTVYNNDRNNVERRIENVIGEWQEEGKEIIIGGDFNIRIGKLGRHGNRRNRGRQKN